MAIYEYRCRECDDLFTVRRPMSESGDPAPCPAGHADTVRLLSTFASVAAGSGAPLTAPMPSAGGGCGGGCGCAH